MWVTLAMPFGSSVCLVIFPIDASHDSTLFLFFPESEPRRAMKNPWIGLSCVQVVKEHFPYKIIEKPVFISPNNNLHCLHTVPIKFAS